MPHIRNNEYPYRGWKRDFPSVSFPTPRDGISFPDHGIWWVTPADPPEHDPLAHCATERAPVLLSSITQPARRQIGWTDASEAGGPEIPLVPEPIYETYDQTVEFWQQAWEIVPLPDPEPEPVPQTVTRAQGKAALVSAGLWHQILAFVAAIPDPTQQTLAEIALNDTQEWRRDSPFLVQAAAALGLTNEQLDDLFRNAQGIVL